MKKQRIYFLLYAGAFGWMGAHRYYVGPTWGAVLYTLFFWTFIPSWISYIELIIYALKTDDEFDAIHNQGKKS